MLGLDKGNNGGDGAEEGGRETVKQFHQVAELSYGGDIIIFIRVSLKGTMSSLR
jgi:hypothetical protein